MEYKLGFSSLLLLSLMIAFLVAKISSCTYIAAWLYSFFIFVPFYYVIYQSWIYPFYISPLRFVPTVPGFPLWGQTRTIITEEIGVPFRRWHKDHGPIIRYFHIFGITRLSVIDEQALKQIMIRNPYIWRKPHFTKDWLAAVLGEGILLAEGDTHVQQRKALAPAFSSSAIKELSPVFWRKALLLSKLWRAKIGNVQTVSFEILDWLNRTTLDIIGEAGFGTEFDSLNHPETPMNQAYRRYFKFDNWDRLYHAIESQFGLGKYLPMKTKHEIAAARRTFVSIASKIIHDKQSKKLSKTISRERDIIALIVRDNSTASGQLEGGMTFESMRDQIITFMGAGHETTASGVAWTLHLLSKYPSTQEKLRKEIREYMPYLFSRESREEESWLSNIDEDRLPYLNNVCRESLRYIPPVPVSIRQNAVDDQLCGYRIPAGTPVSMHTNAINRASKFWGPTADVFDPDRWDDLPETYTTLSFMTFFHGPRGCLGRKFAETEMKTILCCLLSMYRFDVDDTSDDPEDWKMWRIVLKPKYGITLKVTPLI